MRRIRSLGDLVELVSGIERLFHRKREQKKKMPENKSKPIMAEDDTRALKEFVTPNSSSLHSSITRPIVEANNFELKSSMILMVQKNQFGGSPVDDLNLHLSVFLEYLDTL